jgi:GR25 family glycosyltransferase involved in LPS biosynthesis
MFHKLVDKVYAINVESSKERRANIFDQCHKIGTHFELVKAVDGRKENVEYIRNEANSKYDGWTQGAAGLVYTTRGIIHDAKRKGYKTIMILEDDIVFGNGAYEETKTLLRTLPSNWELFHLAAQNFSPPRIMGRTIKLTGAWSCQAYILHERIFDTYLEWLGLVDRPIDSITSGVIHPRGRSFAPFRPLIKTVPNWSDIREMNMNYNTH